MQLKNKEIHPTDEVIKQILGDITFTAYSKVFEICSKQLNLTFEWRYYNDGKAWLCKITLKKKTIAWLSVWDGFIKVSFYFTEKHKEMLQSQPISLSLKQTFAKAQPIGKLIPLVLEIFDDANLDDFIALASFKISLK